jgi:SAM-dependent methyltransferase
VRILEIGCGLDPCPAAEGEEVVHLDNVPLPHVEKVWDLDRYPYPFDDDSFDRIVAKDVLEHVTDVKRTTEELWRIAKPGAKLAVRVPYWSSFRAHRDPTHRAFFDERTFDYFGTNKYSYYSTARLKVLSVIEEEAYPKLFHLLRRGLPRLERGIKKHFLNMVLSLTFEIEVVKTPEA